METFDTSRSELGIDPDQEISKAIDDALRLEAHAKNDQGFGTEATDILSNIIRRTFWKSPH